MGVLDENQLVGVGIFPTKVPIDVIEKPIKEKDVIGTVLLTPLSWLETGNHRWHDIRT